jgi:hypothetical protein
MSIEQAIEQRARHREELRKLRKEVTAEIDNLIDILDRLDGDFDLEAEDEREPDNDFEPSLGSINPTISGGQYQWSFGSTDDIEDEHDGREDETEHGELDEAENGLGDMDGLIEQSSGCYISGMGYRPQRAE